jgi:hypothetical protein
MWPRRRERGALPGLTLLLAFLPPPVAAQGAHFEGGLSVSTGDYVYTQRTSGGAASAGLAWSSGRLTLRATLPWFVRDTRLLSEAGSEPGPEEPGVSPGAARYEGSVGDPFLQLHVGVVRAPRTSASVGFSTKVPLLEAGGFGTGGWDFGGSVSVSRSLGAATLVGFDGSYWHLADPPDLELQDTVMGTVTVARGLGRLWSVSLSLSGSRSAVAGYADPWWVGVLVGRSFSRGVWGVTLTVGLGETAPDLGLGLVWRLRVG